LWLLPLPPPTLVAVAAEKTTSNNHMLLALIRFLTRSFPSHPSALL
jgi:hypothetical protein